MNYVEYIASDDWKNRRDRFFANHERRCCGCFRDIDVDLHHITYIRLGDEADSDLVPLCRYCHELVHHQVEIWMEQGWDKARALEVATYRLPILRVLAPTGRTWAIDESCAPLSDPLTRQTPRPRRVLGGVPL